MKTAVQLGLSLTATASLLVGLASHAAPAITDLAEKPLKASVTALFPAATMVIPIPKAI